MLSHIATYNALISASEKALPDTITYNALISSSEKGKQSEEALDVF